MVHDDTHLHVSDPDLGVLHLLLRPPQRREREGGEIPGQHLPLQRQVTSAVAGASNQVTGVNTLLVPRGGQDHGHGDHGHHGRSHNNLPIRAQRSRVTRV